MEQARLAVGTTARPPGTFTLYEFQQRYNLKVKAAKERIRRLRKIGVVTIVGQGIEYMRTATGHVYARRLYYYALADQWRNRQPNDTSSRS